MGVELGAFGELDRVVTALGVGELDALADGEWTGVGHAVQRASRLAVTDARGCRHCVLGCKHDRPAARPGAAGFPTGAVTVASGGLQAVPVALPVPGDRPAARAG